jgi:hypothetical protein
MIDQDIPSGLGELRDRVGNLERGLADNTATTKRIETDTNEMIEMFRSWQGAMKVLEVIGKAAKPLAAIVSLGVAIGAYFAHWKGGK